jgi:hypothetical protein
MTHTIEILQPVPEGAPITRLFGVLPEEYKQFGFPGHEGVDWAVPVGTEVRACATGMVNFAGTKGAYGLHIRITHAWGETVYAHLSGVKVIPGKVVKPGQLIGFSGNSGNSTGPHLHLTLKITGKQTPGYPAGVVDPLKYMIKGILVEDGAGEAGAGEAMYTDPAGAAGSEAGAGECGFTVRVTSDTLNVRSGPGIFFNKVDELKEGAEVKALELCGTDVWVKLGEQRYMAMIYSGETLAEVKG